MALFFNPEEWKSPHRTETGASQIMTQISSLLTGLHEEIKKYQDSKDMPTDILPQIEDLVDLFFSESVAEKYAVENLFSDCMVDSSLRRSTSIPNACSALFVLAELVQYQCINA